MSVVRLGDDVASIRSKVGMGEDDYRNAWRSLNVCAPGGIFYLSVGLRPFQQKATEICQSMYGNVSLKGTDTLPGILALKDHYTQAKGTEGPMEREKIVAALRVNGAGAWIIHNALKRTFEKYKKGI